MPQVRSPLHSITDLKPGDHACCIYDTDEEHRNIITPFLRKGLEQNEKVVYIADARDPGTIINYLKTDGVDVEQYQKKGQFSILTSTDIYLKGGVFDPDGMMAILSSDTQKALDEGYTALRLTGEMSWALRGVPGSERLIEYEDMLDSFIPESKFLAICQYDRRCFSKELLHDALKVHPLAVIGTSVSNNFYYIPPQERVKENRSGIQPNLRTSNPIDHNMAGKLLRESEEKYRTLVENIQDGVYILDCQGTFQFVNDEIVHRSGYSAEWFIGRHYLDVISPEYHKTVQRFFEMVMEGRNPPIYEVAYPAVSGALFYVELKTSPIFKKNNVVGLLGISRDINERKWAADALRESLEAFKALAENANDGILVGVAGGIHAYANRRAGEITGYSIAELLKTSIMELAAPEEGKNLLERFRKRLSGEDVPHQYETIIIRKDGKTVPIELTAAKTSWHGQPADLVIIRDITERKRAEEALRRERDFAESVIGTAQAIVLILDTEGHIVYINPYMEEISGYNLEKVKGKDWFETFLPSHLQESVRSLFQKAIGDIQTRGNVGAIITSDGRERLIEWYDKTLKNADGSIEGLLAIGQDVTDQRQMVEALRKSEEKYRGLIEQTGEGVWIIDRDYRTTFVNNRLAAMFGYTPREMIGKQIREFMPARDIEIHSQRIRERLEGKSDRFEQKFIRKDGSALWTIASVTPMLAEENRLVGAFAMLTDITDRKRAEEQLKHFNEELESQVRSRTVELERINTLLANEAIQRTQAEESMRKSLKERELLLREVHHRVRNNLQIMLSLIRLQSRNIKDPSLLDPMGEFQNRIKAMAHVHERMYRTEDISRIDLSEIVTSLGKSLFKSYKVDPQHIRLNVEMKDLQITIESAIPLSLIINELISNSIKHAFPKGTTGEITIAGRREADTLVLSIRDTGIGIPEDLDWMRSKQSIGHRLVAILVEQLNGTIELDRTTGTAFNIVVKEKP